MKKKEEENPIYVKLERDEAVGFKKDSLNLEASLLRIVKKIYAYRFLRDKEMKLKIALYKKFKELKSSMNIIQKLLPKVEIQETKEKSKDKEEKQTRVKVRGLSVEQQLKEIERRLEELQNKRI